MAAKQMKLRYAGTCRSCDIVLTAGTEAAWFKADKAIECLVCTAGPAIVETTPAADPFSLGPAVDHGHTGRNLAQIAERKSAAGQDASAFIKGDIGEQEVGAALETIPQSRVLHSRRTGPRSDIDHIVVAPSGVWVVDAKFRSGKVTMPLAGSALDMRIAGRQPDRLIESVKAQAALVRHELRESGIPTFGALCIVGAEWDTFRRLAKFKGGVIARKTKLVDHIATAKIVLDRPEHRYEIARRLDAAFPAI